MRLTGLSWFWSCSCNTHCRAACNFRGTICDVEHFARNVTDEAMNVTDGAVQPSVTAVITLASCRCDDGYTGSQCGTVAVPPPEVCGGEYCSMVNVSLGSSGYVSTPCPFREQGHIGER